MVMVIQLKKQQRRRRHKPSVIFYAEKGDYMSENEQIEIEEVVNFLEDSFWILGKIKWEGRFNAIKENEHYKRILEAIKVLESEHDALYLLIKED